MTTAEVLRQMTEAGLVLSPLPGDRIHVRPKDRLTPELVETIKEHKPEILAYLRSSLTASQEDRLRVWLASVGETDRSIIEDVLGHCRVDADCRTYYLRLARHAEARRMLRESPGRERTYVVDSDLDPVVITVAVRGAGIVDLEPPRDRWQPFLFLRFLEGAEQ